MTLNLTKAVYEFLQSDPEVKYTAREIAEWILKSYPEQCLEKQQRSITGNPIIPQLVAEIGSKRPLMERKFQQFKTTESRPRKYYYSLMSDEAEVEIIEKEQEKILSGDLSKKTFTEHDLYPKLSEFLWQEMNIFSKRVNEKRSANLHGSGGNRWLFPDLIGLEDLSRDWHSEIKHCVQQVADRKTRFWSFEVKKFINRSNVREVYFQAVSNSSWANLGYLVAAEIQGSETLKELRILSGLHGIGLIELDVESPVDSQIMIPARERLDIDWNAANRLAEENPDFLDVIKLVRQFYQTGEHRPNDWDLPVDEVL